MNDRLPELLALSGRISETTCLISRPVQFENDQFFSYIRTIKLALSSVENGVEKINELRQQAVLATSTRVENETTTSLREILFKTTRNISLIGEALSRIKLAPCDTVISRNHQIQETVYNSEVAKFQSLVIKYHDVQAAYKKEIRDKKIRQVRRELPQVSVDQIANILDSGVHPRVLAHEGVTKEQIQNLEETYRDIRSLQQGVETLQITYQQLNMLLKNQGVTIEQIELYVNNSRSAADVADNHVKHAVQFRNSWSRWCSALVIVFIILYLTKVLWT
eukprot:GHVL01025256.1.p1 GENE.GHVL01025256.1~~GHVL01025256.1.p1  ORF type:complete len:278 (+),score=42.14 GHVL01025256.1:28-861(+)